MELSTNGNGSHGRAGGVATKTAPYDAGGTAGAIGALRSRPRNIHLAKGFGPLVVGVALFLLMLWIAPSVAPEHIVEKPVTGPISTVVTSVPTTTTTPTTATEPVSETTVAP